MYKRLLAKKLPYLTQADWISVKGLERPARVKAVILAAETIEAMSFGPGGETVKRIKFAQVMDIHQGQEARLLDKIVANSKAVPAGGENDN